MYIERAAIEILQNIWHVHTDVNFVSHISVKHVRILTKAREQSGI